MVLTAFIRCGPGVSFRWRDRGIFMALDVDAFPYASLSLLDAIACEAGALALRWFQPGGRTDARVDYKPGGSPVTEADFAVDAFLAQSLGGLLPEAGWLSEETADSGERLFKPLVFVVDPIDGTRAFAAGDPRWAVSIALVCDGRPIAGVVHAPALNETFTAYAGRGACLNGGAISAATLSLAGAKIAGPAHFIDKIAKALDMQAAPKTPSLALRFVDVAAGRYGAGAAAAHAHDWDIAAADLILHESGCALVDCEGRTPRYNRRELQHGILLAAAANNIDALATLARSLRTE